MADSTPAAADPTGGGFSIGQFIGKLFSGDGKNFVGGVSPMGDFDPVSFVNANLSAAQHAQGGVGLKDITQGVGQLLGIGKNHKAGAAQPSPDDSAPLNPHVGKVSKVHASHALDFLGSVLTSLAADPNTGAE
jgi:hypothetical protein